MRAALELLPRVGLVVSSWCMWQPLRPCFSSDRGVCVPRLPHLTKGGTQVQPLLSLPAASGGGGRAQGHGSIFRSLSQRQQGKGGRSAEDGGQGISTLHLPLRGVAGDVVWSAKI